MPCFKPLKGYRSQDLNPSGKRSIVFNRQKGLVDLPVELPCGQCIGCRLERSKKWAVRCVHEAQLHDENSFLTLTYADDRLPPHGTLQLEDFQKFMKRLRRHISPRKIKFFHAGEYGEQFQRPHYHACVFGYDFPDKWHYKTHNEQKYYRSPLLEELWPLGMSMIGDVTFESAAYVARYITKKITGERAEWYYSEIDEETGEIREKKPEYATMSRNPGIGKGWFEKYKSDVYPDDFIVIRGQKLRVPKFYDNQLEILSPDEYARIRAKRQNDMKYHKEDNTHERLEVREFIMHERLSMLKRGYEK